MARVTLPRNAPKRRPGDSEAREREQRAERERLILKLTPAPAEGQADFWDEWKGSPPCFGLRVTAADRRSWVVGYRLGGRARRLTLGPFPGLSIEEAREAAAKARKDAFNGIDPGAALAEKRRPTNTVSALAEEWLASREARKWRPRTAAEFERIIKVHVQGRAFGKLDPRAVTRPDVRLLLNGVKADIMADHVRGTLRALFSWAAKNDRVAGVPAFPEKRAAYVARARVLDEAELRRVWNVLDGKRADGSKLKAGEFGLGLLGEAFRLMLLTAQRRGEVLSMAWADISEERVTVPGEGKAVEVVRHIWTIPASRTKNGRAHRVPLAPMAEAALKGLRAKTGGGVYAFPAPWPLEPERPMSNPQRAAGRLWRRAAVTGATLHDLRRTAADFAARSGVSDLHVSFVLNHSGRREAPRVVETYVKAPERLDGPKRAALEAWERSLARILAGEAWHGADVVPFTAAARG